MKEKISCFSNIKPKEIFQCYLNVGFRKKNVLKSSEELNFRESKDRPKTVEKKQLPKGMNIGNSLKDLEKEFKNRFDKEEIKPPRRPGEKQEMQPLSKGGRAGYKAGTRGCKLATKGKGRAYGKNS